MTRVTQPWPDLCYRSSLGGIVRNDPLDVPLVIQRGLDFVTRALKHQGLWLTVAYVGLILLMARAYA